MPSEGVPPCDAARLPTCATVPLPLGELRLSSDDVLAGAAGIAAGGSGGGGRGAKGVDGGAKAGEGAVADEKEVDGGEDVGEAKRGPILGPNGAVIGE